jgi:hypothetical protein
MAKYKVLKQYQKRVSAYQVNITYGTGKRQIYKTYFSHEAALAAVDALNQNFKRKNTTAFVYIYPVRVSAEQKARVEKRSIPVLNFRK